MFSKKLISEPYDSLKEISTKDEDWKYTNISESINDFKVEEENNDLVENSVKFIPEKILGDRCRNFCYNFSSKTVFCIYF